MRRGVSSARTLWAVDTDEIRTPDSARSVRNGRIPRNSPSYLLANRRISQRGTAEQIDLTRNHSIVVNAADCRVLGIGIDDVFENAVLVDESRIFILGEMVANDHSRVVDRGQNRTILGIR